MQMSAGQIEVSELSLREEEMDRVSKIAQV
jgi:hypothetical protein